MEVLVKNRYVDNRIVKDAKNFVKMLKDCYKDNYDAVIDVVEDPLEYILNNYNLNRWQWKKVKKMVKKRIEFYEMDIKEHKYYREKKELYKERIKKLEKILNHKI